MALRLLSRHVTTLSVNTLQILCSVDLLVQRPLQNGEQLQSAKWTMSLLKTPKKQMIYSLQQHTSLTRFFKICPHLCGFIWLQLCTQWYVQGVFVAVSRFLWLPTGRRSTPVALRSKSIQAIESPSINSIFSEFYKGSCKFYIPITRSQRNRLCVSLSHFRNAQTKQTFPQAWNKVRQEHSLPHSDPLLNFLRTVETALCTLKP